MTTRTERNVIVAQNGTIISDVLVVVDTTAETSADLIRTRAAAALLTNRTYLALVAPVGADNLAQIRALTRQNVGLLRMLLNDLDGVD